MFRQVDPWVVHCFLSSWDRSMKCSVQRIWPQRPLVIIVFNFSDMFRQVDPWVVHCFLSSTCTSKRSAFVMEVVLRPYHSDGRVFKFSFAGSFALPLSSLTRLARGVLLSWTLARQEVSLCLPLSLLTRLFLLLRKCLFVLRVVQRIFLTYHRTQVAVIATGAATGTIPLPFC